MSTIRIYSKAAFAIGEGATRDGGIDQFITVPRSFQDMPEKYVTDKTFKSAVSAGLIITILRLLEVALLLKAMLLLRILRMRKRRLTILKS